MTDAPERRRPLGVLRVVWSVAVLATAVVVVATNLDRIRPVVRDARGWQIALAFALLFVQVVPSAAMWTAALRRLEGRDGPGLPAVLGAAIRSLPARYVPGSVWYAASRATLLARSDGVRAVSLATVAVLEAVLSVAIAAAAGAALLLASGREVTRPWLLVAIVVGALAVANPGAVNRVLRWRTGPDAPVATIGMVASCTGWVATHWLWAAGSFLVYLTAFPALSDAPLTFLAGAYLVSWAIGFVSILAPQGAGVFELALAGILTTAGAAAVDTPTAAAVVGGHRALVLVRDAALASIAWSRRRPETAD